MDQLEDLLSESALQNLGGFNLRQLLNPQLVFLPLEQERDVVEGAEQRDNEQVSEEQQQSNNNQRITTFEQLVEGGRRTSNTIFKTSLSEFRKTVLEVLPRRSSLVELIREKIVEFYKTKNHSSFLKLLVIVKEMEMGRKTEEKWAIRIKRLLKKKQQLVVNKKFTAERLQSLKESIETITTALKQKDFWKSFDIYWGNFRHVSKYEKCKKEVENFRAQISELIQKKRGELMREKQMRESEVEEGPLTRKRIQSRKNQRGIRKQSSLR